MAAAVPLAGNSSHHNFQASTRPAPAAIARRSQPRDYLNQASSEIGISRPQRLAAIDAPTLDSAKRPRAALALPPIRPAPDVRVPWAPTAASASASRPRPRTRCVTLASRRTDVLMSVAYEPRSFIHEGAYPPMGDDDDEHGHRGHDGDDAVTGEQHFSSTDAADHLGHYTAEASILADEREMLADDGTILSDDETATAAVAAAAATAVTAGTTRAAAATQESDGLDLDPGSHCFSSPIHGPLDAPAVTECGALESKDPSPGLDSPPTLSRNKQILKPDRDVAKHSDGKYHCPISDCKEDVRTFSRKCEWNKHMDKHERPYRCPAEGCENLPGFTYSGGLLRHEREVHGKHGGPKNTVNCPYPNCKRHTGKGFSRQENLNEHLRRVHTNLEGSTPPPAGAASPEEHESDKSGSKRKRRASDDGGDEIVELRDEVRRVREENAKLKAELEQHSQHSLAMMAQIAELQDALRHGLGAPTARML